MKKIIIIILAVLVLIIASSFGLYFYGLTPVSKNSENVTFNIDSGDSKKIIIDNLKKANLIKSKFASYIYIALNRDLNLQAGSYELSSNMSTEEILNKMNLGEVSKDHNIYTLTFIEGKRLISYAEIIGDATNKKTEEVINIMQDKTYLNSLINKYWFLTDNILKNDIYYALEGYLFPSTYEFYKESTIKDMIEKMLDGTKDALEPYKSSILSNKYNVHEILTMASIVEQEGIYPNDRSGVAGVFYNRLNNNWTLGSDATTYYAVKKDYSVDLSTSELNSCNGYNTRGNCVKGLPVGPICSPSITSIKAAINPTKHDYYFFVADNSKQTYFTKTNSEHEQMVSRLKSEGKWYEYN